MSISVLNLDFHEAFERKAEDDGEHKKGNEPMNIQAKEIQISGRVNDFDGFYRYILLNRLLHRIQQVVEEIVVVPDGRNLAERSQF